MYQHEVYIFDLSRPQPVPCQAARFNLVRPKIPTKASCKKRGAEKADWSWGNVVDVDIDIYHQVTYHN